MATFRIVLGSVFLVLISVFLGGCPLFDDDDDATNTAESDNIDTIVLQLNVVDDEGVTLEGASVSAANLNILAQTYDNNAKLAVEVEPAQGSTVLRVEKAGYEPGLVYVPNTLAPFASTVKLKERLPAILVEGSTGGEFSGVNGARVSIDAESLQRPDGTTATGEILLYINTVDTSDEDDLAAFPGSFEGLASADTEPGMLASLGVTSFHFEQNGEKLQLKDGAVSQLILPLYADAYEDGTPIPLGDLIPMWRLNEETGIWEEESIGVVVEMPSSPTGLGLQASTRHFSSFNADVWGPSALSGSQSGPSAQSRTMPQICRVAVRVPEFEEGTPYIAVAAQNLGALASSRSMTGVYYELFTFPVFQGRPSALRVTEPNYNNREGRSTVERFTCNSDTLELLVQFDAVPAFLGVEALSTPVFEIVNGMQEITSNILSLRAIFINDSDNKVQFTSNMGLEGELFSDVKVQFAYLPTDPDPVSIAFYLENDLGDADTQTTVDYIAEQAPTVVGAYLYKYEGTSVVSWFDLEGADTAAIYEFDPLTSGLGILIESDIDATEATKNHELAYDLPEGTYVVIFQNQYGTLELPVFISGEEGCLPNSDIPCSF